MRPAVSRPNNALDQSSAYQEAAGHGRPSATVHKLPDLSFLGCCLVLPKVVCEVGVVGVVAVAEIEWTREAYLFKGMCPAGGFFTIRN